MNREEAKIIIRDIYKKVRLQSASQVLKKNKDLISFLDTLSPFLKGHSISEKCYWIINNIFEFPKCKICNKELVNSFSDINHGYRPFCSRKCASNSQESKEAYKQTMLSRYGVDNPSHSKILVDKAKKTMLSRYGVEYACQSQVFLEKSKKVYLQHYGVDHPMKTYDVKQKCKNTCIQRYNVDSYSKTHEFHDRFIKTMISRYGVKYASLLPNFKEKVRNTKILRYGSLEEAERQRKINFVATSLQRYGVVHPFKCKQGIHKYQETCLKKFGSISPFGSKENKIKNRQRYNNLSLEKKVLQHLRMVATNRSIYGVDYAPQSLKIRQKISKTVNIKSFEEKRISTNRIRYGYDYYNQNPWLQKLQHSKYYYDNKYFDSVTELLFYKYLLDNNINFEYHPKLVLKYIVDNKVHYYHPDFKIDDQLIEIKGDQFFDQFNNLISLYDRSKDNIELAKQKCMIDNNVIILKESILINNDIINRRDIEVARKCYKVKK